MDTAGNAMADELTKIEFGQTGDEYPGADALRVARGGGRTFAIASATRPTPPVGAQTDFAALEPANPARGWRPVARIREMVPVAPAWDVVAGQGGGIQIVYEKPGGAINALVLRSFPGGEEVLSRNFPMQSFSRPHFARDENAAPQWITAVRDNRACVAFPLGLPDPVRDLGECAEAILVRRGAGYLLLTKTTVPGPVRGNATTPGTLRATVLDEKLEPTTTVVDVGDETIFEFDSGWFAGVVVTIATTAHGFSVFSQRSGGVLFERQQYSAPLDMSSPMILSASADRVQVGALDGARLVTADLRVP